MSPSELPKIMGLKGVHRPDALCHFVGLTSCPWCGKEGKNEGTVVNHLHTMPYKLGLVCSRCLHFPSITSEAIQHQAKSESSPGKVMPKRKMGGLTTYPHWTNQSQPSPPAKTLSATVTAIQVPQNIHTFNHSYFPIFMQPLITFLPCLSLFKSIFINNFTMFTLL